MRKMEKNFNCKIYRSPKKLPQEIQKLIAKANAQTKFSYAPYSNFLVGAAILLENGQLIGGCNQENVSYPLCICAERVALYTYGSKSRKHKIKALAVTARNKSKALEEPCMPCGACRQVIQEYETRQGKAIDIYATAYGLQETILVKGISQLLPSAFNKDALI